MDVRMLGMEDAWKYETALIEMLRDNYRINYPELQISDSYCREKFENLISFMREENAFIWAAFLEGRLAGFAWAFKHEYYGETRLHINHIYVKQDCRKKGVGRTLMAALQHWTAQNGIRCQDLYVRCDNAAALALYSSLGFVAEKYYMTFKPERGR